MCSVRLHSPDGDDLGEVTFAMMIHACEELIADHVGHLDVTIVARDGLVRTRCFGGTRWLSGEKVGEP